MMHSFKKAAATLVSLAILIPGSGLSSAWAGTSFAPGQAVEARTNLPAGMGVTATDASLGLSGISLAGFAGTVDSPASFNTGQVLGMAEQAATPSSTRASAAGVKNAGIGQDAELGALVQPMGKAATQVTEQVSGALGEKSAGGQPAGSFSGSQELFDGRLAGKRTEPSLVSAAFGSLGRVFGLRRNDGPRPSKFAKVATAASVIVLGAPLLAKADEVAGASSTGLGVDLSMVGHWIGYGALGIAGLIGLITAYKAFRSTFVSVDQGYMYVTKLFGKYRRVLEPGLHVKIPFFEKVFRYVSIQNQSQELQFQAITNDQANVYFKTMILYSVVDQQEDTIKKVAFKFIDDESFMRTLKASVEGSVRSFVATKKQAEILGLRSEIVDEVKRHLDKTLAEWGYHLQDLQVNDITFDKVITESMADVVASQNLKAAAANKGEALLITKTKEAEAAGRAIIIAAESEKKAATERGQGVAGFRTEVAKGWHEAADEMKKAGLDPSFILFGMWTETLRHLAAEGKGNTIFLDGSVEGMQRSLREMMSLQVKKDAAPAAPAAEDPK